MELDDYEVTLRRTIMGWIWKARVVTPEGTVTLANPLGMWSATKAGAEKDAVHHIRRHMDNETVSAGELARRVES